jgi:tetratricopeptide (TPR) repeat protein
LPAPISAEQALELFQRWRANEPGVLAELRKAGTPLLEKLRTVAADAAFEADLRRLIRAWVVSRLEESIRSQSMVRFFGQFADLKPLGGGGFSELALIVQDEDQPFELRVRAAQALGDVATPQHLPAIARMQSDFLIEEWLELELGYLAARLGDDRYVRPLVEAAERVLQSVDGTVPSRLEAHARLAEVHYRTGNFPAAVRHYQERIALLEEFAEWVPEQLAAAVADEIAISHYNLACSQSLSGKLDAAFDSLRFALVQRGASPEMILTDGDLEAVRADARFDAWLAECRRELSRSGPPQPK